MPRSEAQRRAYEALRPPHEVYRLAYLDDAKYCGVRAEHRGLGIELVSQRAFYDPDGVLYLEGVVTDPVRPGFDAAACGPRR